MNGRRIVPLEEKWLEQMAQIEILCFSDPWSLQALAGELESPLARYFLCVEGEKLQWSMWRRGPTAGGRAWQARQWRRCWPAPAGKDGSMPRWRFGAPT